MDLKEVTERLLLVYTSYKFLIIAICGRKLEKTGLDSNLSQNEHHNVVTQRLDEVPSMSDGRFWVTTLLAILVVLGLTLMVLSAVALIEERRLTGLGFGLISALLSIISAAFGIQQCDLKVTSILNIFALFGLFPTFYFSIASLIFYSKFYFSSYWERDDFGSNTSQGSLDTINEFHTKFDIVNEGALNSMDYPYDSSTITTIWTLSWLELFHLIPLAASILYLLFLYRHLSYYTHC